MKLSHKRQRQEIEHADQVTWGLLVFAIVRGCAWLCLILCVAGGLVGIPWLHWAATLGGAVVFIGIISLYANAEGEFSQVAGYWAALRAGRAHAQGVEAERADVEAHREALEHIETVAELIHDHQLRSER